MSSSFVAVFHIYLLFFLLLVKRFCRRTVDKQVCALSYLMLLISKDKYIKMCRVRNMPKIKSIFHKGAACASICGF